MFQKCYSLGFIHVSIFSWFLSFNKKRNIFFVGKFSIADPGCINVPDPSPYPKIFSIPDPGSGSDLFLAIYGFQEQVLVVDIRTIEKRILKKMKDYLTKTCAGSGIRKNLITDPDPGG
jgi:hypothetical protein